MYVIYQHINRINGMRYIGRTKIYKNNTPEQAMLRRLKGHMYAIKYKSNLYFHNAISDYGIENFDHYVIQTNISTSKEADKQEKFWIKYLDSKKPNGYNLTNGGEGGATRTGKKPTQAQHEHTVRLNKSRTGQTMSKETCDKMSKSSKGKKKSKEHSKNIGLSKQGKSLSVEHCLNISKSKRGSKLTIEHKQNVSKSLKGKKRGPFTQEHKDKLSKNRKRVALSKKLLAFYIPGELWNN